MTSAIRLRLCLIWLLYLGTGVLIGGDALNTAVETWNGHVLVDHFPWGSETFHLSMKVSGAVLMALLVSKALGSARRHESPEKTASISLYTPDFTLAGHLKAMALIVVPEMIAWAKFRLFD